MINKPQKNTQRIKELESMINDLTLTLELWLDKYPFDEHHIKKQRALVNRACLMIGKPRTIDELKEQLAEYLVS